MIKPVKREYRVLAIATVVLLSGCQSNVAPQTPSALPQSVSQAATNANLQVANPDVNLGGERLSTSTISTTCASSTSGALRLNFSASGTAAGPFPGTFYVSGAFFINTPSPFLNEAFYIFSGSTKISGFVSSDRPLSFSCSGYKGQPANSFSAGGAYDAQGTSGRTTLTYNKTSIPKFSQTFAAPVQRKPSIVQSASGSAHAAPASCTFSKTPIAGNVIIFGVGFYPSAVTITPPAGVTAINATNAQEHDYYRVVRTGDGRTWTFTGSGTSYVNVICYEVTGENAASPIDAHGENHTTTQIQTTASVTPVTSGDLPIAFFGNGSRLSFTGLTSGWTNDINETRAYAQFGAHGPLASLSAVRASITLTGAAAYGGTALVLVKP